MVSQRVGEKRRVKVTKSQPLSPLERCDKPKEQPDIAGHAESMLWDESDIALITYGDSILSDGDKPLSVLHQFCHKHFTDYISWIHILPFFSWTSDDGFSVLDYSTVNQALGGWEDIETIGKDFKLMADLVLNHCSSRSVWFENFKQGVQPGKGFSSPPMILSMYRKSFDQERASCFSP